jgi:hypothetical protein
LFADHKYLIEGGEAPGSVSAGHPLIVRGPTHDDLAREHLSIDDLPRGPADLGEDLHVDLILYRGQGGLDAEPAVVLVVVVRAVVVFELYLHANPYSYFEDKADPKGAEANHGPVAHLPDRQELAIVSLTF